jgi:2-oxoglutarate ferredoxin oxidoreductase subunit alpha
MHIAASDEHDERGDLISDVFSNPTTRVKMMEKRARKMEGVRKDVKGLVFEGPREADVTLVGWGSTYPILKEVRGILEAEGRSVNHVQFRTMWPFPAEEALKVLSHTRIAVVVENNQGGLFGRLLRQETGLVLPYRVRKFDGEPFSPEPLAAAVRNCLAPGGPPVQTLVSSELDIPGRHS